MKTKHLFVPEYKLLLSILILVPGLSDAQDLQSAINLTRGERYFTAGKLYQSLLLKDSSDSKIYYYYGENYLQKYFADTVNVPFLKMADSAELLFKKGIQKDPLNPLCYAGMGEISLVRKTDHQAQKYFNKAIGLLPSKTNQNSMISAKDQATVYIQMASAFIKANNKDTSAVFTFLKNAEKLNKLNFDLYLVRGDAYLYLVNQGSPAIENYRMAQTLNPSSPLAYQRIGQLWARAGMYEDALEYYDQALKIDPDYVPTLREKGSLLYKLNKKEEAAGYFQKFLKSSKGTISSRIQYINTLMDLKDYQEAISQLKSIQKADTLNNDFNRALAYAYYENGQYPAGLLSMKKFFEKAEPGSVRISDYIYFGRLLTKNNQDSLAGNMLLKAYNLDTLQSGLLPEALNSFIHAKEYDKAVEVELRRLERNKNEANDFYTLGKLYYNMHEWKKADSVLSIVNQMQPAFIPGYLWRAYALVNLDQDSKKGLAKPVFDSLIEKASADSLRYVKELKEAYSYMAYYYFMQYIQTRDIKNGEKSMEYCRLVLARDPADEKAEAILKELIPRIKK
jgi:tetratricopeptide (TPR) repeat protein